MKLNTSVRGSLLLLLVIYMSPAAAWQTTLPEVGKPCPDFTLSDVTHFEKSEVRLRDFKGKWLFLEFWFTGCSTCIWNLRTASDLQREFEGDATFLLVGYDGGAVGSNIREIFEKLRVRQGLRIPSAYDSTLAKRWGFTSLPYVVAVDPDGIVRAVTPATNLTTAAIRALLAGEKVIFSDPENSPAFNPRVMSGDAVVSVETILHHSVLTRAVNESFYGGYANMSRYASLPTSVWNNEGIRMSGVSFTWLYSVAYLGKPPWVFKSLSEPAYGTVYPSPIIEVADTAAFGEYDNDSARYNYFLWLRAEKRESPEALMERMQDDLERAFGYTASVEERSMPVWKLVVTSEAKNSLFTKGGEPFFSGGRGASFVTGFTMRNIPMRNFLTLLCFYLKGTEERPFIDATAIENNIDINIDADLTNLEDVRKELRRYGLDLVPGNMKMKVLVVKDVL